MIAPMLPQFETILRKALPNVELPSNLSELMLAAMKDIDRDSRNDFSFVKPTIDVINKSSLKTVVKLLPFMPDRINYMIDQERCCAIEYDSGLFTPCCKACVKDNKYCKGHAEKPTPFGDYAERLVAWNDGQGVGTLEYEVEGKKYVESTYGEYLLDKKIAPEQVKQALKDAGIGLRLNTHDMQVRPKTKKVRGRPSEKKVQAVSLDGEEESAEEVVEAAPVVEEKPKRTKLTPEEKAAKEAAEAKEKAEKKEKREAEKKVIAERKAEEEIIKAKEKAEKLAKKAEDAAKKAAEKAAGSKPKPKAANPVRGTSPTVEPPPLGTPLDAVFYDGDLDDLDEVEDPESGNKYWLDDARNVYDASKKKVGTVDDEGELTLF